MTGRYVSEYYALRHPNTTVKEAPSAPAQPAEEAPPEAPDEAAGEPPTSNEWWNQREASREGSDDAGQEAREHPPEPVESIREAEAEVRKADSGEDSVGG